MMTWRQTLSCYVPDTLRFAVHEVAKYRSISASSLIREAISHYLATMTLPNLLDGAKGSTSAAQMRRLRLVEHVKTGLIDNSDPGRLRLRRLRGYYMQYCRACRQRNMKRTSFALWATMIDEIQLTDPAGFSAPTPAAKRITLDAKRARAAKRESRRAQAASDRAALYRRLGKPPPK